MTMITTINYIHGQWHWTVIFYGVKDEPVRRHGSEHTFLAALNKTGTIAEEFAPVNM